jgi:hypothetical protein
MMKRVYMIIPMALVLIVLLTPFSMASMRSAVPDYVGSQGSVVALKAKVSHLSIRLTALKAQYDTLSRIASSARARVNAGIAPSDDMLIPTADAQVAASKLEQCTMALRNAQRLEALAKPMDIVFKSASIRQAAEALSRAAGISITVDEGVPKNIYVKTQAHGVPLGAVLEVIADTAHLVIAPDDQGGLLLRVSGRISINGKSVAYDSLNLPWSEEWTAPPCAGGYVALGHRWLRLIENLDYLDPEPTPPTKPGENSGATSN